MAAAPSLDARPRLKAWLAVLSVALGTFVLVTTEFLPIGLLTSIAADLGVSKGTAGLSVGMRLVPESSATRATSLILAGISVGTVLGVPVGALIGEFAGWRAGFIAAGALAAVVLITQLIFLPRLPTNHAIDLSDFADTFRDPVSRLGLIAMVVMFVGQFAAYTYMEPFLKQVTLLDPHLIAALLVSYGLAGLVGNFLTGAVVSRDVRLGLLLTAGIIGSMLVLLPVLGTTFAGAAALIVIWGFGFGSLPVSVQTWMIKSKPEAPEGNMAVMVSVIQFALAGGALTGGMVVDRVGIPNVMYFGGLMMALALAWVVASGRTPERRAVPAAAKPCTCC